MSEAAVRGEAEELEMPTERYVQDLQQALTETESSVTYSFCLAPSPPDRSSTVTLAYEKVQKNISVSKTRVISLCSIYVVILLELMYEPTISQTVYLNSSLPTDESGGLFQKAVVYF